MRNNLALEYAHLLEGVRRGILSSDQLEQLQALARSMRIDRSHAPHDLRWTVVLQSAIALIAVAVPTLYGFEALRELSPPALVAWSALLAVTSMGVGEWLARGVVYRVPAAILRAGACFFVGGVAMGLYAQHKGFQLAATYGSYVGYDTIAMHRLDVLSVGLVTATVAAIVVGLARRIPFAAAVAAVSSWALALTLARVSSSRSHGYLTEMQMTEVLIPMALVLFVSALVAERIWRREKDPAFWLHLGALATVGLVALVRIDRRADEALLWMFALAVMVAFGLRRGRRIYAVALGIGMVTLPAYGCAEARCAGSTIVLAFVASAVTAAVAMASLRRNWTHVVSAEALEQPDRSVWA